MGCGRFQSGDAKTHYKKTEHPIVIEINEQLCHWFVAKRKGSFVIY